MYKKLIALCIVLVVLCACSTTDTPELLSAPELEMIKPTQAEELSPTLAPTVAPDPNLPTEKDWNAIRASLPFEPFEIDYDAPRSLPFELFEIDYDAPYIENGYLDIDKTTGILEHYLRWAMAEYWEIREIPDILQDHNLILQTASLCTIGGFFGSLNPPPEFGNMTWYSVTPKEHLDLTAKYLFGDECVIDYDNLVAADYLYLEEGLSYREWIAKRQRSGKERFVPTIVEYQDFGDYYQATIVYLYRSDMLDELSYFNGTAANPEDKLIFLTKETAKEFCRGSIPDKYSVRINKGENQRLYLRSVLQISKE